jgi:hypothetical protein
MTKNGENQSVQNVALVAKIISKRQERNEELEVFIKVARNWKRWEEMGQDWIPDLESRNQTCFLRAYQKIFGNKYLNSLIINSNFFCTCSKIK